MPANITTAAIEKSTYVVNVALTDENDAALTPQTATWTLCKTDGTIVNDREDVVITSLSASMDILLSGLDLALTESEGAFRIFTIEGTYNSDLGNDLPFKEQTTFFIDNLKVVS